MPNFSFGAVYPPIKVLSDVPGFAFVSAKTSLSFSARLYSPRKIGGTFTVELPDSLASNLMLRYHVRKCFSATIRIKPLFRIRRRINRAIRRLVKGSARKCRRRWLDRSA